MNSKDIATLREFANLDDPTQGLVKELASGVRTRLFFGDKSMLSIASFAPDSQSTVHSHPEEQWGVLLEGDGIREQNGVDVAVKAGDFWRTPGGVTHGFRAGPRGAKLLDIFSPPREVFREGDEDASVD